MRGSIAGYNLFTFIAFALSFCIAYLFIYRRFLKHPLLVSLLSLAITFTPFAFILDEIGHTSYLFMPAYLFAVIWLILCIQEKKQAILASVTLGLLAGCTFIFDPYFILFIPLAIFFFTASLFVTKYYKEYGVRPVQILIRLAIALVAALAVAIPVLLYLHVHSAEVNAIANNTRIPGLQDAYLYSAHLIDYLLPAANNPLVPSVIAGLKSTLLHGTSLGTTLFLGWTLLVALISTIYWWIRHKAVGSAAKNTRKLGVAFLSLAIGAFLFSLPPTVHLLFIDVYTPTWVIATLTPTWRVFSRLYFVVQPALVMVVVCWMVEYMQSRKSEKMIKQVMWIAVALSLVLLLEYVPRNPFDANKFWSFSQSLPKVYDEVRDSSTKVLAEYPMREQPYYRGSLYLTGQHLHNKATINAYSPTSPSAYTRMGLMDLNNPQTIPALHYLGADTLLVWNNGMQHWTAPDDQSLLLKKTEIYTSQFGKNEILKLYTILPSGLSRRYVATVQNSFRPSDDRQLYGIKVPLQSGISLASVDLCQELHEQTCTNDDAPTHYSAQLDNISGRSAYMTLVSADGNDSQSVVVNPGKNNLNIKMNSNRYVIKFDTSLNSRILITNQEIVQ
jgi:hypothetical protein